MSTRVSWYSVGYFEDIIAIFGWNWSQSTPKSIQQQKRTFFEKIIHNFCSNNEHFCRIEIPLTWALKQKGIHTAFWGKRRMKLVEFRTKVSKVPIFLNFRQH